MMASTKRIHVLSFRFLFSDSSGQVVVKRIETTCEPDQKGRLKVNDEVIAINGRSITQLSAIEARLVMEILYIEQR